MKLRIQRVLVLVFASGCLIGEDGEVASSADAEAEAETETETETSPEEQPPSSSLAVSDLTWPTLRQGDVGRTVVALSICSATAGPRWE